MHRHANLGQEPAQQREANAHHAGRVTLDALDEPVTEPVRGERTGHMRRLAGSQRAIDLSRRRHRNQTRTGHETSAVETSRWRSAGILPLWLAVTRYRIGGSGLNEAGLGTPESGPALVTADGERLRSPASMYDVLRQVADALPSGMG